LKYNLRSILKAVSQEGFQGMYRGFSISLFCIPVFNTIYFPMYEHTK